MDLKRAEMLSRDLMKTHGLGLWSFEYDGAKTRFGLCTWSTNTISLSAHLVQLNSEGHVVDSILHEIAHALAGPKAKHSRLWRSYAKSIGCNGLRCYGKEVVTPPKVVKGECPNCHKVIHRHRRKQISCALCCNKFNGGKFSPSYLFKWERI